MIAALRVDERLIHGQISMSWSKALKLQELW
ncbi:PTS sugar transporter subunit IIB [Lactobacillus sp. R2/2]|nr:PTS sugar transporter subunit IIB [Lactobacillus sp. R2/2]